MSKNLKKCIKELKRAMAYRKGKRKIALDLLSNKKCIYNGLREIAMNIINQQIPLNKTQKNKINIYSKTLRKLAKGVKSKRNRKNIINQTGGFLPWLLPIVATIIQKLVNNGTQ